MARSLTHGEVLVFAFLDDGLAVLRGTLDCYDGSVGGQYVIEVEADAVAPRPRERSEEHTSELQSLMRISYAVFCLKKKTKQNTTVQTTKKIANIHKKHKEC